MNFADKLWYYGPQIAKACDQLEAKTLRESGDIYIIDLSMGAPKWDLTAQGRTMFESENHETEKHDSALNVQVAGDHYKQMKIQPVEYIHANNIPFIEGCIIKYVSRHKGKNGRQDLLKARHFIDLLLELEYPAGRA